MKYASIAFVLSLLLSLSRADVNPASSPGRGTSVSGIAEGYVKLVLAIGNHEPDSVDAYYGLQEWKKSENKPLNTIAREATQFREQLGHLAEPGDELDRF